MRATYNRDGSVAGTADHRGGLFDLRLDFNRSFDATDTMTLDLRCSGCLGFDAQSFDFLAPGLTDAYRTLSPDCAAVHGPYSMVAHINDSYTVNPCSGATGPRGFVAATGSTGLIPGDPSGGNPTGGDRPGGEDDPPGGDGPPATSVPAPTTLLLVGSSLAALGGRAWTRRRRGAPAAARPRNARPPTRRHSPHLGVS